MFDNKKWREDNKEKLKAQKAEYYQANRDKILARVKKWSKKNRKQKLALQKAWYRANKEKQAKESKERYEANKTDILAKQKKYYEKNKKRISKRGREYYQKNKSLISIKKKAYRQANKEKLKAQKAEYYLKNRETLLQKGKINLKKWKEKNREWVKIRDKKYRLANIERIREKNKEYKKNNPEKIIMKGRKRRAVQKMASVVLTDKENQMMEQLELTRVALQKETGKRYHLDHVLPLAHGGIHHPCNIRILESIENISKAASILPESVALAPEHFRLYSERINLKRAHQFVRQLAKGLGITTKELKALMENKTQKTKTKPTLEDFMA